MLKGADSQRHGSQHSQSSAPSSVLQQDERLVPPPLNLPNRSHKSVTMDEFEKSLGEDLTKLDYYEEIRRKPIKCLMTREISQEHGRETYLITTIKEILIYTIFLIVLGILVLETPSTDMYMLTSSMVDVFMQTGHFTSSESKVHYADIQSIPDIWDYLAFVESNKYGSRLELMEKAETDGDIHDNLIIGIPRIRSVRVRNDSCHIVPEFAGDFKNCFGYFTEQTEETRPFGPKKDTPWTYSSPELTGSQPVYGMVSTYSGGGYYLDLQYTDHGTTTVGINDLRVMHWIDEATRAVIFTTTTYNANINLFCIIRILFELPPSGGVIPSFIVHTLKLIDYDNKSAFHITFISIFVLFFMFYTVEEFYEMTYFKWQFIKSFWNFVDVGIVMLCYMVIVLNMCVYVTANSQIRAVDTTHQSYFNLEWLLMVQVATNVSQSLLIFLCWGKVLKYLSINHSLFQLQVTIKLAAPDILLYSTIFLVVFSTVAFEGYLLFGLDEYHSTFWNSAWALFRAGVGDFHFNTLVRLRPTLGFIYFFLALFLLSFVFVPMYLAILLSRYSEVRSEVSSAPPLLKVSDVLQSWLVDIISTFSRALANRARSTFNNRKMRNKFQDVRYLLLRCGFTELEINMFLAKYEVAENRIMTEEDMHNIMQNFKAKGLPGVHLAREIVRQSVEEKLKALEDAMDLAAKKIETVLSILESIELRRSLLRQSQ